MSATTGVILRRGVDLAPRDHEILLVLAATILVNGDAEAELGQPARHQRRARDARAAGGQLLPRVYQTRGMSRQRTRCMYSL
jgi:hypothetical protein